MNEVKPWRISVAPMMDWTDRHCRYLHRLISRRALLYTEMVTSGAIIHGDRPRHLDFNDAEHPIALQLGGSDPQELAQTALIANYWAYDEINLNVGCPSDRVQNGRFGACLMAEPQRVADSVAAMMGVVNFPVTVKTRIGIDELDSYEYLVEFIRAVADAGCERFIIHARKAWLSGLSPKQNREIPPLCYDRVHRLKEDFPHLQIILNGGLLSLEQINKEIGNLDGAMLGRAAYHNPWILAEVDQRYYGEPQSTLTRFDVAAAYIDYIDNRMSQGVPLMAMSKHILGLFHHCPGARGFRRYISENAHRKGAGPEVIRAALDLMPADAVAA